ncbi:MAG: winged helix-turn-helix transcriptional regulator [Fimbriimonadaceae bacterium]|nr:winged helix-turn-helix transcriptional regulator [Fimbriimonadaceae bacterium]
MVEDRLDVVFLALSDPTRRAMLTRLSTGESSVGDLARPLNLSLPGTLKHLRTLERAGLVTTQKRGRTRYVRGREEAMADARAWMEATAAHWKGALDRLELALLEEGNHASPRD